MNTGSIRIAILTSLGLIPLGCLAGSARDVDGGSVETNADSRDPEDPAPILLDAPACGDNTPVSQEHMAKTVVGYSPPVTQGLETGIYRCESGLLHRPEPFACGLQLPRPLPPEPEPGAVALSQVAFLYPDRPSWPEQCTADADCSEKPNGYCAVVFVGFPAGRHVECKYGCLQDADCGEGFLCECGDPVGRCVAATCRSDQDCGGDLKCGLWLTQYICSTEQYYTCQSPDDTCNTAADCGEREYCSGEGGTRTCLPQRPVVCGRPFLVEGEMRVAELRADGDWALAGAAMNSLAGLGARERSLVGEHWSRIGIIEHASIAAFARFTLQLLHLGAPRELIEASQRAMLDETEHTKACFALATRYLGMPVGPGPLPMDAALQDNALESVTRVAFLEGCVGETLATLEALAALDGASDSAVRSVLARIAEDELGHAELAWRFVGWALSVAGVSLRSQLVFELAKLEREMLEPSPSTTLTELSAHGVLSESGRALARRAALAEVVLPCARALLALADEGTLISHRCAERYSSGLKIPSRAVCQIRATEGCRILRSIEMA